MSTEINNFYMQQLEPTQGCLLALRNIILNQHPSILEVWKYKMPFFCINNKMLCYLWIHKKHKQPYIGFVKGILINHNDLLNEKRAKMKILLVNPHQDLSIQTINSLLQTAINLH
jgi:hypothetical protein